MKKFCLIQHWNGSAVDVTKVFFDRPTDKKAALAFWSDCVNGKQRGTRPNEWQWIWLLTSPANSK